MRLLDLSRRNVHHLGSHVLGSHLGALSHAEHLPVATLAVGQGDLQSVHALLVAGGGRRLLRLVALTACVRRTGRAVKRLPLASDGVLQLKEEVIVVIGIGVVVHLLLPRGLVGGANTLILIGIIRCGYGEHGGIRGGVVVSSALLRCSRVLATLRQRAVHIAGRVVRVCHVHAVGLGVLLSGVAVGRRLLRRVRRSHGLGHHMLDRNRP
mmetsp:Transcript_32365/g.69536  ORF Transcript_32365/g.69536 Transcript_32365/m.69536 type:complete len:210 (+) Transcript_32365:255-884(+)